MRVTLSSTFSLLVLSSCGVAPRATSDLAAPGDLSSLPGADLAGMQFDLAAPPDLVAAPDMPMPPADLASTRDMANGNAFAATLGGIWLVGWSGGLDHFTWIRFDVSNPFSGPADFLEATGKPGWIGFWPECSGKGQWLLTQKPDTVQLKFPPQCNLADVAFTFTMVQVPMGGGWPAGAILEATFDPSPPAPPQGYKYPNNRCDQQFTMCMLP